MRGGEKLGKGGYGPFLLFPEALRHSVVMNVYIWSVCVCECGYVFVHGRCACTCVCL